MLSNIYSVSSLIETNNGSLGTWILSHCPHRRICSLTAVRRSAPRITHPFHVFSDVVVTLRSSRQRRFIRLPLRWSGSRIRSRTSWGFNPPMGAWNLNSWHHQLRSKTPPPHPPTAPPVATICIYLSTSIHGVMVKVHREMVIEPKAHLNALVV